MKPTTDRASSAAFDATADQVAFGWAARLVLALLAGYKLLISPHFAGSCRFLPSCADYARDAVATHGALRGVWLALRRLARCHPLCEGGHDPVPPSHFRTAR